MPPATFQRVLFIPPFTEMIWPVMYRDPSPSMKMMRGTRSREGLPNRPSIAIICAMAASWATSSSAVNCARCSSYIGVHIAGTIVLAVMPYRPQLAAMLRVQDVTAPRSEEHTSELQSLMRTSYAVVRLKNKNTNHTTFCETTNHIIIMKEYQH